MAQLAIKGHPTKGTKVIEILRLLGGINALNCAGLDKDGFYYIGKSGIICHCGIPHNCMVFTIEEFLEKYPYKVGDRVIHNKDIALKVVTMYWDDNFNIVRYDVQGVVDKTFTLKGLMTCHLQPYKETMENQYLNPKANRMDKEFEQEFQDVKDFFEKHTGITVQDIRDNNAEWLLNKLREMSATCALQTISDLYDELHKPQYPKTYEECCRIVVAQHNRHYYYTMRDKEDYPHEIKILDCLDNLRQLLICRDTYWKIAGEQMELGRPWEPESIEMNHAIVCRDDGDFLLHRRTRAILIFPTEEMRNAFFENFKELIEQCKELL